MPHGISPPHSAHRSSNCYSLLWDSSTSLPVSTATRPSYNISTLSYKFFLSPMEVHAALRGQLSTIFSSNKSSKTSSCIPDCPATLMQDFYGRNELLVINSTDKLSAPSGANHQHTRGPYKLSDKLLSWLPPLLLLLLIFDEGTCRAAESTLADIPFNKDSNIFNCTQECPTTITHLLAGRLLAADLPYKENGIFHLYLGITL